MKFSYKCVFIWALSRSAKKTSILNEVGEEGWELVAVVWCWHYFKRAEK